MEARRDPIKPLGCEWGPRGSVLPNGPTTTPPPMVAGGPGGGGGGCSESHPYCHREWGHRRHNHIHPGQANIQAPIMDVCKAGSHKPWSERPPGAALSVPQSEACSLSLTGIIDSSNLVCYSPGCPSMVGPAGSLTLRLSTLSSPGPSKVSLSAPHFPTPDP